MFDSAIIGSGPAGLTAYLYCLLYGLKTVCIGQITGGKLLHAPGIQNYPGFSQTSGTHIIEGLMTQITHLQGSITTGTIQTIHKQPDQQQFILDGVNTSSITAKTIILATGNGNKQQVNSSSHFSGQLHLTMDNGLLLVDELGKTNQPGVYAAGDCTSYPFSMEQLITAVSSGIHAASGVYEYINNKKPPIIWGTAQIPRK